LSYLPFCRDTWERATRFLGADEKEYWTRTNANPYEAKEGLEFAIDCLVEHGRARAALGCLAKMRYEKLPIKSPQAIKVLQSVLASGETPERVDAHAIVEVIKDLQEKADAPQEELLKIEWACVPILNEHLNASPKTLGRRLADDPSFFRDIIRTVFRSDKDD